eukprot:scaffold125576_cov62-Cyclotella_meneghiniana.AAC.3
MKWSPSKARATSAKEDKDTGAVEIVCQDDHVESSLSTVISNITKATCPNEEEDSMVNEEGQQHDDEESSTATGNEKKKKTILEGDDLQKSDKLGIGSYALVAMIGVSIYAVWKYALGAPTTLTETKEGFQDFWESAKTFNFDDFKDVLKNGLEGLDFASFFDEDPRIGDNGTYVWREEYIQPNQGGLHLMIANALDDTWQDEFYDAVADWTESPALELTTERIDVDHNCTRIEGVMVVCNANFGDTGWVGINENELWDNVIYSSVSKMNEYYLRNADYGHGFGLPHTDENPYNTDMGNCLDYTVTPDNNLYPGQVNYQKLNGMYNLYHLYSGRKLRRQEEDGRVIETSILYVDEAAAERGYQEDLYP